MKCWRCIYLALFFGFLLGCENGFIALWEDGIQNPIEVFPYQAQSLPAEDQKALQNGIKIETKEELILLLEDYLS